MNKHIGQKVKRQGGFEVNYSKSLTLCDNKEVRLTRDQMGRFKSGGKVILPQEIFTDLVNKDMMNSTNPIQFRVHSPRTGILCLIGIFDQTHNNSPDKIFVPEWIHEYLDVQVGESIFFSTIKLPKCTEINVKPDSTDFYDLQDHERLLTQCLPDFSAIMEGQWLCLTIDNKKYWLQVLKCIPQLASLIDTDVRVIFESADGLEDYERKKQARLLLNEFNKDDFYQVNSGNSQKNNNIQVNITNQYVAETKNTEKPAFQEFNKTVHTQQQKLEPEIKLETGFKGQGRKL